MKRKILISIFSTLFILFTSCSNYLDVKEKGKIIPETAEDYSTIIQYWLDQIEKGTDDVIVPAPEQIGYLEMFAEDLDATLASSYYSTYMYVGASINKNQDYYTSLYSVIKDCNMIIDDMDDTKSDLAKTLLGTAWSMRTICYYNLMKRYCEPYDPAAAESMLGLPLVDKFDMEAKPGRSNLKETSDFIIKGFQKALSYNVSNQDYIFTTDVVKAYMARFYFWIEDWDNAITYADEILKKYPMLELDEYVDGINKKFDKTHNVIIRSYTEDDSYGSFSYASAQADIKSRPVSGNLISLFNKEANDIRAVNCYDNKRLTTKLVTNKFHSEELCLIISESYAHKGDNVNALKYLNLLRSKRITKDYMAYTMENLPDVFPQNITVDATGMALTKLMSVILCERRKELFVEGDRWFELKRNGRPEFWVAADGKKYIVEPYLYTFAIPKTDVDLYPGLVIQNPGYIE